MPRRYTNLEQYGETILQMKEKGCTRREIAEKVGITPEQVHQFICRNNRKQRNMKSGILPNKKGRPLKPNSLEAEIARLRMENELLRDFLSLTGRK